MRLEDYNWALKAGAKILPHNLAGMMGLPYVGNVWYVDPVNGSDTANAGKEWDDAFATLSQAYDSATNNNHDVILLAPAGTSSVSESASITWSKNQTHLIGNTAPTTISPRARILSAAGVSPLLTVSGQGNSFVNVQFATFEDNNELVNVTGNRNYFGDVHISGMGDATAGDDTSGRSLTLNGAEENLFAHSTIGLDTIARSTTNAEIELKSGSTRNMFESCRIISLADNAGHLWVKAASAADVDRFVEFRDTVFYNAVGSTGTTMTVGMDLHASLGGLVLLTGNTMMVGATDWADDFTNLYIGAAAPTAASSGIMVQGS